MSDDVADHADIGPAATLRGIRSLVAVPLLERERAVGVLILFAHRTPRHFEAAEVDFAKRLATTVGLAIENARLFAAAVEAQLAAGLELRGTELLLEAATVLSSWTDGSPVPATRRAISASSISGRPRASSGRPWA